MFLFKSFFFFRMPFWWGKKKSHIPPPVFFLNFCENVLPNFRKGVRGAIIPQIRVPLFFKKKLFFLSRTKQKVRKSWHRRTQKKTFREGKFKSALRVGFSCNFTKIFCGFPTTKFEKLIYIWLTHHEKNFDSDFLKILCKTDKVNLKI